MNEPDPPELNRTLAFCRCSSHCGVGSKLYFCFSCAAGGLLNNHIPSSAKAVVRQNGTSRPRRRRNRIPEPRSSATGAKQFCAAPTAVSAERETGYAQRT